MEEIVKSMGFESLAEFNKMVSDVDLSSADKIKKFKEWQNLDGTKEGLIKLTKPQPIFLNKSRIN